MWMYFAQNQVFTNISTDAIKLEKNTKNHFLMI